MRYLLLILLFAASGCGNADEPGNQQKDDTTTMGVDSTRVGNDSGILRKLP
ncbi:MAG TPA: hypothetical protein VF145_08040 [Chitinophagaceae bacterium]